MMEPLATKIKSLCAHLEFYILNLSVLDDASSKSTMFVELGLPSNAYQYLPAMKRKHHSEEI